METSEKILYNMSKSTQREIAKSSGFYDGRFKTRSVMLKKFKKPKHKSKTIQID